MGDAWQNTYASPACSKRLTGAKGLRRPFVQVYLVNPSDVSFGVGLITPQWLYVLADDCDDGAPESTGVDSSGSAAGTTDSMESTEGQEPSGLPKRAVLLPTDFRFL
jgi:hypothetical protein